jgi:hypothetical protein
MCSQYLAAESQKPKAKTMSDDDDSILAARNGLSRSSKKAPVAQKFTKATKAYKHLEKMFKDKAVQPTDKPSDVRHHHQRR